MQKLISGWRVFADVMKEILMGWADGEVTGDAIPGSRASSAFALLHFC